MARSIATGLTHLHLEIEGTQGKPAIAHRDLKSRNILVKKDLTCLIADLGLCVRLADQELDIPFNNKVGTKRYMAPELLDESINERQFDAWKRADVYSLALVFWELASRTKLPDCSPPDYLMPYHDKVNPDPTIEEMRAVVCDQGARPELRQEWDGCLQLRSLAKVATIIWLEKVIDIPLPSDHARVLVRELCGPAVGPQDQEVAVAGGQRGGGGVGREMSCKYVILCVPFVFYCYNIQGVFLSIAKHSTLVGRLVHSIPREAESIY
jgi:serine/threonine protein kinase